jgi:signal peptidase I
MFRILKISGDSLVPYLTDGDFVLTSKIPIRFNLLKVGDIVAFQHPNFGLLIKRIDLIDRITKQYFLLGTQPNSIDSRVLGLIDEQDLVGKVLYRVRNRRSEAIGQ